MAERFTPLIGLAVVVALAFAVVLGAVGLSNPAFAGGEPVVNPDGDLFRGQTSTTPPSLEVKNGSEQVTLTYKPGTAGNVASGTTEDWQYRYGEVGDAWGAWTAGTSANLQATNTETVSSLTNGLIYRFQARAIDVADSNAEVSGTRAPVPGSAEITSQPSGLPERPTEVAQVAGPMSITLTWEWARGTGTNDGVVTSWQYIQREPTLTEGPGFGWTDLTDSDGDPIPASARSHTFSGLDVGVPYRFGLRALAGTVGDDQNGSSAPDAVEPVAIPIGTKFTAGSSTPGSNTNYVIEFPAPAQLSTGVVDNVVVKLEDFSLPSNVNPNTISITATGLEAGGSATTTTRTANPGQVNVDDDELKLTLKTWADDFFDTISSGTLVRIAIGQGSGVRNPTEVGDNTQAEVEWDGTDVPNIPEITIYRKVTLSENAGGRGDVITATGKGFKNGQGITFWLDRNGNGDQDPTEDVLCTGTVDGNDVGTCDFTVSNPPFDSGVGGAGQTVGADGDGDNKCRASTTGGDATTNCNLVNAVDGRGNKGQLDSEGRQDDATFELEASISVTPSSASYGEAVQIQLTDYIANATIHRVAIAGEDLDGNTFGTVDAQGSANFSITIPNIAPTGRQDLKVWAGDSDAGNAADARTTITVAGPTIRVNPSNIVANQRVSMIGSGFTPGAYVCCGTVAGHPDTPRMSIGGEEIPTLNINDGANVLVDNGGNWSAAVDLPLEIATTSEGAKTLRVTDSQGRDGEVTLNIPARQVTITPDTGRLGTTAVVRGQNFPGKNDDGVSYSLEVAYKIGGSDATRVTATPDASGSFEVEIRVPTSATIPSTNSVEVRFTAGTTPVITTVTHEVPEGTISLSADSGPAGSTVTVTGGGFKNFVPVTLVRVGNLEVTPAPRPSTDAQGETSFDITVPGLDVGIQTVEVRIGDTTASIGFTVTPSGINAGDITPSAEAVANLGDAFVRSFHFNNDTKAWTFYDPAAGDASTQENFISGETYWVLVSATTEAILNGETRNMTCVSGNCWNQIVW